MKQVELRYT